VQHQGGPISRVPPHAAALPKEAPIVEKLLSPPFAAHAVKTLRQPARRQRGSPPVETAATLAQLDAQIAELERLVGALQPPSPHRLSRRLVASDRGR
jgi:hypothetical protein